MTGCERSGRCEMRSSMLGKYVLNVFWFLKFSGKVQTDPLVQNSKQEGGHEVDPGRRCSRSHRAPSPIHHWSGGPPAWHLACETVSPIVCLACRAGAAPQLNC